MARRTGFPKVARRPEDDGIVVGAIGTIGLRPGRYVSGTPIEPRKYHRPGRIVEVYERGADEPPRAIRVHDELLNVTRFFVCSSHAAAFNTRAWFGRGRWGAPDRILTVYEWMFTITPYLPGDDEVANG